ncbi:MAG: ParA family protein [Planctomycetes bacterium]|nr:ParA family protein [Planctomycetota bacterium]
MGKIIAVANQKGGVGKTTTAITLSTCLAMADKSVLLVDADTQRNAASGIAGIIDNTPRTAEEFPHPIYELIQFTTLGTLRIITLENIVTHTGVASGYTLNKIKEFFNVFSQHFDYIIFDCPPSVTQPTILALSLATDVIIPMQCEYFAMEGLSQILNTIKVVQKQQNIARIDYRILLTMYDASNPLTEEIRNEVKSHFKNELYSSMIHRDNLFPESSSHALPIVTYAPFSRGSWNYINFTKEVLSNG